ncbi:RnfABCDGE type electron transport complex subunit A [candidate division KSB1 bacterium]|nr:RnfABCDGE type electron transport complex subunit A [candidate division KSB1 bacterium]
MDFGYLLTIAIGTIFINNFVLARFLGLCPYLGVSRKMDSAVGMGLAVIFVMTMASTFTWLVYTYLLSPVTNIWGIDLIFLRTIAFILVIASLVQFCEIVIQKVSPHLYKALGIYLPLITTNCAILGVAVLNIDEFFQNGGPITGSFIYAVVQGFTAGLGFTLALVLMAGLREKLEMAGVPESLKGQPIAFIMAGLMAIAFLGFSGFSVG